MLKVPHFFKGKSRVGLTHPPIRHKEFNLGVEDAPDVLLDEEFLKETGNPIVDSYVFQDPEKIHHADYWVTVAGQLKEFTKLINSKIKDGEVQVVVGGDNTITLSSLQAVIERVGDAKKVGYIQFDSHGEMHQSATSISKNFHGMYMRPFFDKFDIPEIDKLVPDKMSVSQILTIGNIVFDGDDSEEERFYKKNNIRNITKEEFDFSSSLIFDEVEYFVSAFEHIHINFDVDVFHRSVSEATGLPEDGRWLKEPIFRILDVIAKKKSLSLDIVEINPKKEGGSKTISLAKEVVLKILS